jgi:hypothetical protein
MKGLDDRDLEEGNINQDFKSNCNPFMVIRTFSNDNHLNKQKYSKNWSCNSISILHSISPCVMSTDL